MPRKERCVVVVVDMHPNEHAHGQKEVTATIRLWHGLIQCGVLCNCALEDPYARFECRHCAEGFHSVQEMIMMAARRRWHFIIAISS